MEVRPDEVRSRSRTPVMTNPEMTKNTSTPTKPPERADTPEWKRTTRRTATARRPSTSGRKGRSPGAVPASSPDGSTRSSGGPRIPSGPVGQSVLPPAPLLVIATRSTAHGQSDHDSPISRWIAPGLLQSCAADGHCQGGKVRSGAAIPRGHVAVSGTCSEEPMTAPRGGHSRRSGFSQVWTQIWASTSWTPC